MKEPEVEFKRLLWHNPQRGLLSAHPVIPNFLPQQLMQKHEKSQTACTFHPVW